MLLFSHTLRRAAIAGVALAFAATAALAQAGRTPTNVDAAGVILKGFDAVAYQTESRAVKGSAQFTATHDGATYHFASAANRDRFVANPAKFEPMYGGYCAMGVAVGKKLDVDPTAFTVHEGRLFVNVDTKVRGMWAKDVNGNNTKADRNWAEVSTRTTFDKM